MSWKSSVCPFPGWHLAWVVKVVVPSWVNKLLEFGFCFPGHLALGVHAGSGIMLELPTRTSVSKVLFWKISLGTLSWKSFSKALPCAVATGVKLEIFLKSIEKLPFAE